MNSRRKTGTDLPSITEEKSRTARKAPAEQTLPPTAPRRRRAAANTSPAKPAATPAVTQEPAAPSSSKTRTKAERKKAPLVRDDFTMPADEFVQLAVLKQRVLMHGIKVKKNQLLRIGLQLTAALDDGTLLEAIAGLAPATRNKPGRKA